MNGGEPKKESGSRWRSRLWFRQPTFSARPACGRTNPLPRQWNDSSALPRLPEQPRQSDLGYRVV